MWHPFDVLFMSDSDCCVLSKLAPTSYSSPIGGPRRPIRAWFIETTSWIEMRLKKNKKIRLTQFLTKNLNYRSVQFCPIIHFLLHLHLYVFSYLVNKFLRCQKSSLPDLDQGRLSTSVTCYLFSQAYKCLCKHIWRIQKAY